MRSMGDSYLENAIYPKTCHSERTRLRAAEEPYVSFPLSFSPEELRK